jgi:hypothetical protein
MVIYVKNERRDDIEENIHKYLYKIQIYISGVNCVNSKIKSYLEDNYDLMCFNSKLSEDVKEEKLVLMMGSSLMIVMFENNEIQKREINTAIGFNIPILFIYKLEEDKLRDKVNEGEDKIVFKNLEEIESFLKDRFKLIKKIKKRKNLPFKTLESKTELFEFDKITSISILKEKKKLLLAGKTIQSLDLHSNTPIHIKTFQFNEGQLNVCVNNKGKEIIILKNKVFLKNRVFAKYNFDFIKTSEVEILELLNYVYINEIVVNEENKHVYGISNNQMKLFHFDKEFKLIQTMNITTPLLIKLFNNYLYMLLKGYGNINIGGRDTSQIIENESSFIGVYSQKGSEFIKFKRKIILDVLVQPLDFHVDENYIFIFSRYINTIHVFNTQLHVFDHDGIFLQKTGLDFRFHNNTRFLFVDNQTIHCADYDTKSFKRLEFQKYHSEDDKNI